MALAPALAMNLSSASSCGGRSDVSCRAAVPRQSTWLSRRTARFHEKATSVHSVKKLQKRRKVRTLNVSGQNHGADTGSSDGQGNVLQLPRTPGLKEQIKEMAAAERRWEAQVTEGRVKSLSSKEAGYSVELNTHVLLDVRPSHERQKSCVRKSVWVPAFEEDQGLAPGTLLSRLSNFALGGWWSGSPLTKRNERFMPDVVAKIPKSANVIVACQKGLRSLAACEQLYKAGYRNLFWLNGGFDTAGDGDFEKDGEQPLKYAGIGGVSGFLGWTDVQRAQARKEGIKYRLALFARLAAVVVGADLLLVGSQQLIQALHH